MKPIKFSENWFDEPRIISGIMTGNSLDGIDTAIVEFSADSDGKHHFKLLGFEMTDFPQEIKYEMMKIFSGDVHISDISMLNYALPSIYSESLLKLCKNTGIKKNSIDAIGVHGQTVWHEPPRKDQLHKRHFSTLQLGNPSVLANLTGVTVVGDFRAADLALGGQGAPLAPIFDYEFFRSDTENIIALNIGGIANGTFMPAGCKSDDVTAFDTGPGNILIDAAIHRFTGMKFDYAGESARRGKTIQELMTELQKISYIRKKPPKSTGRELFNANMLYKLLNELNLIKSSQNDILRTITEFTAWSICENIRLFMNEKSKVIVSGGGRHNIFLMEIIQSYLPDSLIIGSDELGMNPDAKEAIFFAYLAYRTLGGLPGNMPSVTGAGKSCLLGVIALTND
ncbi:MAG: Anhydro-N-acetylmuramic acid kinase [Bacteroidota bacterium]|nr:Anhydro-N-acetylmuramic acid kinase [Bacteroidota bacterium]